MSFLKKSERFKIAHIKCQSSESACEHMERIINTGGEILCIQPDRDPVSGTCWTVFYVTLRHEGEIIKGIFTVPTGESLSFEQTRRIAGSSVTRRGTGVK